MNTDTQLKSILEYANLHKEFRSVDIENILSIKATRANELIKILIKNKKIES